MGHHHGHGHDHSHHHTSNTKVLGWTFFLISGFMIVEIIGGLLSNSLALLSDAGHMLSDAAALGLSYLALKFGQKKASLSKTFGYKRFEILAAFINGLALLLISVLIIWEAVRRFFQPPEVLSNEMLIIAIIGLLVNVLAAFILLKGNKEENLNVRSAFVHVLGDMLGSVGAIIAALLMMAFDWKIADPIASIVVSLIIIKSGWSITKEALHILMEGIPHSIDFDKLKQVLENISHVKSAHDIHVWSISSDFPALSCHLVVPEQSMHEQVLLETKKILHDQFGVHHTTIQIECKEDISNYDNHCN